MEQVAQRIYGCPVTESAQSQVGQGFKQPDLVKDGAAHGERAGLDGL